ncbi:MAG: hypothetical protein AABX11_02225 [Nanoarchaeota archaeon]
MKTKENKSIFLKYFGDTPQLRVMDFLIDNQFFDYPVTEIAKGSNVSYNSFIGIFPWLVSSGILIKTRKVGKSDYFKLNTAHPFVVNLIKLDWQIVKHSTLKDIEVAV